MNSPAKTRITSLDLLRGLVMIVMALDHTRDYIHAGAFVNDPLDLTTTSAILFFTRWVTHFCAPVFVFLAGTSVYLQGLRKSREELSVFLFKRGLWLMFVELVIITFAWTFDISYHVFIMQVIWAIGVSMFLMGVLIRLPFTAILVSGLSIVFGHNVFDGIEASHSGFWWDLMRNGSFAFHEIGGGRQLVIVYPFLPWLGVMMAGYCFGTLYAPSFDPARRKRWLRNLGIASILVFTAVRFLNVYGDPNPWTVQGNPWFTLLSFINTHKYPPSLLFLLITLGPSFLLLAVLEKSNNRITQAISVFGRVPFLYYVVHLYLLHAIGMAFFLVRGHSFSEATPDIFGIPFRFVVAGEGYSLGITYLVWIAVVVALYPLCRWFSEYKKKNARWWLSYL
ncbi:MAG: DUF1624 domain-containing protein [Bacteroidetes bacterium]|nr:DUF1624 domain-containing protein [Bacteroidota bacterium]MCW5894538.1 DUF1624 domain-containing protein [Bacteroidota bacterium]